MHSLKIRTAVMLLTWIAGSTLVPRSIEAAGCHRYETAPQHLGHENGKMAEGYWKFDGPVSCVYEYGEFKYFQIASDSMPCDGPGCDGRGPADNVGFDVLVEVQRETFVAYLRNPERHISPPPAGYERGPAPSPSAPLLSGLLRPPQQPML